MSYNTIREGYQSFKSALDKAVAARGGHVQYQMQSNTELLVQIVIDGGVDMYGVYEVDFAEKGKRVTFARWLF